MTENNNPDPDQNEPELEPGAAAEPELEPEAVKEEQVDPVQENPDQDKKPKITLLPDAETDDGTVFGVSRKVLYPVLLLMLAAVLAFYFVVQNQTKDEPQSAAEVISNFEQEASENPDPDNQTVTIGDQAVDIKLKSLKTDQLVEFDGQPTMIEFIATWCPHCQAVAPLIAKELPGSGVQLITVGAAQESDGKLLDFHENFLKKPMPGEIVNDSDQKLAEKYAITGTPTMVFVNADGEIVDIQVGEITREQLQSGLNKAKGS